MKQVTKKQKMIIGAALAVSLLGIGGTGLAMAGMDDHHFHDGAVVTEAVKVSMKKAENIALKEVGKGEVIQTELIQKNIPVYQVTVAKEGNVQTQIELDANTGKITAKRSANAVQLFSDDDHRGGKDMRFGGEQGQMPQQGAPQSGPQGAQNTNPPANGEQGQAPQNQSAR